MSSGAVEKRAAGTVKGYLWTIDCTDEHYDWGVRNGCFAYYSGSTLRDMYSVLATGNNCHLEFFGNGQCAYFSKADLRGSNVCGHITGSQAFQSVRVNCN